MTDCSAIFNALAPKAITPSMVNAGTGLMRVSVLMFGFRVLGTYRYPLAAVTLGVG